MLLKLVIIYIYIHTYIFLKYNSNFHYYILLLFYYNFIIEHLNSTSLNLVGLQVWRGALLLADFLLYHNEFCNQKILELAAGVGLTSIAAGIYSNKEIICTDVDIGDILNLIRTNIQRNKKLLNCEINVMEIDFKNFDLTKNNLKEKLDEVEIVVAADGKFFIHNKQKKDNYPDFVIL